MNRITLRPGGLDALADDQSVAELLEPTAERIAGSAQSKLPSWVQPAYFFTHAGVGPRGAYAQAIGRGSGIVLAEYGGRRSPAHAMFRSSI